ncbi:hypothetical protein D3C80_1710040 [compost metagenome]
MATVLKCQANFRSLVSRFLQLPAFKSPTQFEHLAIRLSDIDIDGIELLDNRKRGCLAIRDQRTFGHSRTSNSSTDGSKHFGVSQVDLSALDLGFRLHLLSSSGVVLLPAHRLLVNQLPIPSC